MRYPSRGSSAIVLGTENPDSHPSLATYVARRFYLALRLRLRVLSFLMLARLPRGSNRERRGDAADPRILTKGSCWGHGKKSAYVDLAVEGTEGLRAFVERVNVVDRQIRPEGLIDVTLNWSEEVVTACAFDLFPNWIMLSWRIEGIGRGRSPSATLLAKTARAYRAASRSPAPR